jgi:hypothetical protein
MLSPELIGKARDDTAGQVTRILLTFVGTAMFCVLSLLTPDSALLAGNEKLNVPLAGPVSFFGFILLGPTILIAQRVYLQIYLEHARRLDRLLRRVTAPRAPTLMPLENPLLRIVGSLAFYLLLPGVMFMFTWKAAVFPAWGTFLLCVTVAVSVFHAMIPFNALPWRFRSLLSGGATILIVSILANTGWHPQRPFNLFRANLTDQWLTGANLAGANLAFANLARANLERVNLQRGNLTHANLTDANLTAATLRDADLRDADLSGTIFFSRSTVGASGATDLRGADLRGVRNLRQEELGLACTSSETRLPPGLFGRRC